MQLVDGELEEEGATSALTLTQAFPFEACPPTTEHLSHSPALQLLIGGIGASTAAMSTAERNSLVKVVHNISAAFSHAFSRWTVGLGIEPQLNQLRYCLSAAVTCHPVLCLALVARTGPARRFRP